MNKVELSVRAKLESIMNPSPDDNFAKLTKKMFLDGEISLAVVNGKLAMGLTKLGERDPERILREIREGLKH